MKANQSNIFEQGKHLFENTPEYRAKVTKIEMEVASKYTLLISGERNFFKRLALRIKMLIETRKRIQELSSPKNLHLGRLHAVIAFLAVTFPILVSSQAFTQNQKISAADRTAGDIFGWCQAISGSYAIIGSSSNDKDANGGGIMANAGAAYIYKVDGNKRWYMAQKLVASDRTNGDYFGTSVAIDGDYAVVGSWSDDHDQFGANVKVDAGSAYIFEKNSNGVWIQVKKIVAPDRATGDYFGYSVAVSGNYLIVGSRQDDEDTSGLNVKSDAGSAYIYQRNSGGTWTFLQKICANDRRAGAYFGHNLVIEGDQALVGAYFDSCGSVYSFVKKPNGRWEQAQKLEPPKKVQPMHFGFTIGLSGNSAVIGAFSDSYDKDGNVFAYVAGAAYFFEKSGNTWTLVNKVTASDRAQLDEFGISVGLSGNTAVIGSWKEDEDENGTNNKNQAGSAYVFKKVNGQWAQVTKLCAPDRTAGDEFGRGVSISGETIMIGAYLDDEDSSWSNTRVDAGSVHVYYACTNKTYSTINPSACGRYISPSGSSFDSTGTYTDIISNKAGCDSVITINLTVTKVNTLITKTGKVLNAQATGSTFRWLDCSNYSVIPSQTQSSFSPSSTGNYAVEVTKNSCVDTSACVNVNLSSIISIGKVSNIQVFPNPGNGQVSINTGKLNSGVVMEVRDLQGRLHSSFNLNEPGVNNLSLDLESGVYFLVFYYEGIWETHTLSIID